MKKKFKLIKKVLTLPLDYVDECFMLLLFVLAVIAVVYLLKQVDFKQLYSMVIKALLSFSCRQMH